MGSGESIRCPGVHRTQVEIALRERHADPRFCDAATDDYIAKYAVRDMTSAGSSLKFCLVATGEADALIGGDLVVSAGAKTLGLTQQGRTGAVVKAMRLILLLLSMV